MNFLLLYLTVVLTLVPPAALGLMTYIWYRRKLPAAEARVKALGNLKYLLAGAALTHVALIALQ